MLLYILNIYLASNENVVYMKLLQWFQEFLCRDKVKTYKQLLVFSSLHLFSDVLPTQPGKPSLCNLSSNFCTWNGGRWNHWKPTHEPGKRGVWSSCLRLHHVSEWRLSDGPSVRQQEHTTQHPHVCSRTAPSLCPGKETAAAGICYTQICTMTTFQHYSIHLDKPVHPSSDP